MTRKEPPASFAAMCSAFHQDAAVLHGGSLENLARDCTDFVPKANRGELAAFLADLLERRDNSELRRALRKQKHVELTMSRDGWWSLFDLVRARLAHDS